MNQIKLTFDDGSGTACIDSDWIIGRHQYDGRTLVVYGYDTTLWVSETVEEIDGMLRDAADCDECVGMVYDHWHDADGYTKGLWDSTRYPSVEALMGNLRKGD